MELTDILLREKPDLLMEIINDCFKNREDIQLLSTEFTTLNNTNAVKAFYLQNMGGVNLKMVMITAIKGDKIYYLGGGDSIPEFPNYLKTLNSRYVFTDGGSFKIFTTYPCTCLRG